MNTETKTDPYPAEWAQLPRVTDIVRFAYPDAFAGIPERDKAYYFERGSANHLLWSMMADGTADAYDFDPEVQKYRPGYEKFLKDTGFKPLPGGIECRVKNEELGYKGTYDLLGTVGNRVWLIDLKTTKAEPKPTALQTALYLLALPGYKFSEVERYGIGIRNDGKYAMTPRFPDSDENDAIYWAQKFKENRHD